VDHKKLGLKKFFWDIVYNFTRQGLTLILGLFTSIFLTRGLGVDARGIYSLVFILPALATAFANLGIAPATVYLVAHKEIPEEDIFSTNMVLTVGSSLLGIAISLVLAIFFNDVLFPGVEQKLLLVATINIPVSMLATNLAAILLGKQDFRSYNTITLFPRVVQLILSFLLVWLLKLGIQGAIVMHLTSSILHLIVLVYFLIKLKGIGFHFNFKRIVRHSKRSLKFGLKAYIANVIGFLNYRIDKLILNSLMGSTALGYYDVSVGSAERLWILSSSIATVVFPKISSLEEDEERNQLTLLVLKNLFLVTTVIGAIAFFLISPVMVLMYGVEFEPAAVGFKLLLPGIIAVGLSRILANDMSGRNRPEVTAVIAFIGLILNIILNYVFVPRFGFLGASIASSFSFTTIFIIRWMVFLRISGRRWFEFFMIDKRDVDFWKTVIWKFRTKISEKLNQNEVDEK